MDSYCRGPAGVAVKVRRLSLSWGRAQTILGSREWSRLRCREFMEVDEKRPEWAPLWTADGGWQTCRPCKCPRTVSAGDPEATPVGVGDP